MMRSNPNPYFPQIAENLILPCRQKLEQDWSPAEFTLFVLFTLAGFRSPKDQWMQIDAKSQSFPQLEGQLNLQFMINHFETFLPPTVFREFFLRPFSQLKKIDPTLKRPLIDFCGFWRWKKVPLIAWKSLQGWHSGKFPLQLRFDIPNPEDLLALQRQGQRCVSVFCETKDLKKIHEHHRDAFLFTLHDLEHAWQFFSNPEIFHYQKEWCRLLDQAFIKGPWKTFIDFSLQDQLNYIISDMNSHPWHTFLTLQHLWRQNWKRRLNKTLKEKLTDEEELECERAWQELLHFWNFQNLSHQEESQQAQSFMKNLITSKKPEPLTL